MAVDRNYQWGHTADRAWAVVVVLRGDRGSQQPRTAAAKRRGRLTVEASCASHRTPTHHENDSALLPGLAVRAIPTRRLALTSPCGVG
jgi:hypothetical protein